MIARIAVRELRAMGVRALLLLLTIAGAAGAAAGAQLAVHNIRATRDHFYSTYRLADLDVRLARPLDAAVLRRRAQRGHATRSETRLIVDGEARIGSGSPVAAEVVGTPARPPLNRLARLEGAARPSANGAVLEADFAKRRNLHVGDSFTVAVAGHTRHLTVRGLARSPEYLLATADPDYLIIERGSLAVVFLPLASVQHLVGAPGRANDLALQFPGGPTPARIDAATRGLPVRQATPRDKQYSFRFTQADLDQAATIVPVITALLTLVAVVLIAVNMMRFAHAARPQLGVLMALGYGRPTAIATVLVPAAILGAVGGALALGVTLAVGAYVAQSFTNTIGFPSPVASLELGPAAFAVGLALGTALVAAALPAWRVARLDPAHAMRGEVASASRLVGLLRASLRSPAVAYGLRNAVRRPWLTTATILSLAVAIALGSALHIVTTSVRASGDDFFARQGWNWTASLRAPMPAGRIAAVARHDGATTVEALVKGPARLSAGGRSRDVDVVGAPPRRTMLAPQVALGSGWSRGRVAVADQVFRGLHARVGEHATLRTAYGKAHVVIGGSVNTIAGTNSYLPPRQAGTLVGAPGMSTDLLLRAPPRAAARLRSDPRVVRVVSKSSVEAGGHEEVSRLNALVDAFLVISVAIGGLFLISSVALSFLDRVGEFATLQAVGWRARQLATAVLTEGVLVVMVACAISVALAPLAATPIAHRIDATWFTIALRPTAGDFAIAIGLGGLVSLAVLAHSVRRILNLDLAPALRARIAG